jgi:hypothetical protein
MDTTKLEQLGDLAADHLIAYLQGGGDDEGERAARIATSTFATYARLKQVDSAREAVRFTMARELSADDSKLRDYMRITMPDSPITKALPIVEALPAG